MTYETKPLSCDPARITAAQLSQLAFASAAVFVVNGLKREELVATNFHDPSSKSYFDGLGEGREPGSMLRVKPCLIPPGFSSRM